MKLELREIELPLRHPFTTAHGSISMQRNLLVELSDGEHTGRGESPSSRAWPQFNFSTAREALQNAKSVIEGSQFDEPQKLWQAVQPLLAAHPFALCALDQAAHDLWGKRRGLAVWQLWGLRREKAPLTSYTIGLENMDRMVAKMREFDGWPIYKIKLGTDHDLEIVRELRRHSDAVFRIDANTAWTVDQTIALAPEFKALGVEFIEQPLPRDDWHGMKQVHRDCVLPVMADESCQSESDVERCAECFSSINIKLCKAGGLTPARRMIDHAQRLGLGVMVGCMCESSIGISANAQLLPLLDYADLDGALLLAEDIADGVKIERGCIMLSEAPGTGVKLR